MDILGIGFPELIFIFVIALMVFGPRRLPEIAGKAGKFVADLRNMSHGLMAEWQREIKAAEITEEINKTRQEFTQARDSVTKVGKTVSQQAADVANSIAPAKLASAALTAPQPDNSANPAPPGEPPAAEPQAPAQNKPEADPTNEISTHSPAPSSPPASALGLQQVVNEQ